MTDLDDIRTEYMRSLPDAYAGGPTARTQAWARLVALINDYADSKPQPKPAGRKTTKEA